MNAPASLIGDGLLDSICLGLYFPNGYEIRQLANELRYKRLVLDTHLPKKHPVVISPTARPV
jgi:hypothetical protein